MSSPAITVTVTITSTIAMIRVFQNGRVSTRSQARLTALMTAFIAPLAAQTVPKAPITKARAEVLLDVSCCKVSIVSITS